MVLILQGTAAVKIPRACRSDGLKVLGANVSLDNCSSKAIAVCVQRGWAAFKKHRSVLCGKRASLFRRLALLDRFVRPAVMYCIGSLNPTKRHLQSIRGMQGAMIRKMLGWKRPPEIELGEYMLTTARKVKRAVESSGLMWWDEYLLKQIYSWAGHLGRMSVYDPSRVALQSIQHKGRRYLISLQEEFGQQCHGKRFHVWRWEKMFYNYFGADWMQCTLDSDKWFDKFHQWLQWKRKTIKHLNYAHKETYRWMNFSVIDGQVNTSSDSTDRSGSSTSGDASSSTSSDQV
jgi:hypothetical protein